MRISITLLSLLIAPVGAFAHAADHAGEAATHYFTSLFHLFPIAGIIGMVTYQIAKGISSKNIESNTNDND